MADGDKGFGQQNPSDSAGKFNSLAFIIWQQLAKVSTMKVVIVKAVDAAAKTVDVQPMVNELDGQSNATPWGTIFGIPYVVLQYGKNAFMGEPAAGDIGLMICADRDISAVKSTKKVANPGSDREFDVADGVYLGGILNGDPEQWIKFLPNGGINMTDKFGNVQETTNAGININGVVFNRQGQVVGNLPVTGNLMLGGNMTAVDGTLYPGNVHVGGTVTGDTDVVFGNISGKNHHHLQSGGGNTGPALP